MADKVILKGVLFLDCPEDICTKRCLGRGAKGSGRTDDNPESLLLRHKTYVNDTMPIIKHYEQQNIVFKVHAAKSPKNVFQDVRDILSKIEW